MGSLVQLCPILEKKVSKATCQKSFIIDIWFGESLIDKISNFLQM